MTYISVRIYDKNKLIVVKILIKKIITLLKKFLDKGNAGEKAGATGAK